MIPFLPLLHVLLKMASGNSLPRWSRPHTCLVVFRKMARQLLDDAMHRFFFVTCAIQKSLPKLRVHSSVSPWVNRRSQFASRRLARSTVSHGMLMCSMQVAQERIMQKGLFETWYNRIECCGRSIGKNGWSVYRCEGKPCQTW